MRKIADLCGDFDPRPRHQHVLESKWCDGVTQRSREPSGSLGVIPGFLQSGLVPGLPEDIRSSSPEITEGCQLSAMSNTEQSKRQSND
jgi:hypothetical protein